MRIKNVLLIFLAFFLIMVPSVVGAEESDESIVEDTEVDENESGEAKSEESETIETEDETSTMNQLVKNQLTIPLIMKVKRQNQKNQVMNLIGIKKNQRI